MRDYPALVHLSLQSQAVAEHVLHAGYDGVVVDVQHGEVGVDGACTILRTLPREVEHAWVRIPSIDPGVIGRLLDAGARGVIAPAVETATEAQALVRAAKYPPRGGRSLGPSRPEQYPGPDYTAAGSAAVSAVVQIETAQGVAAADEILPVPGLDSVYVGPADLALSYGLPPRLDWQEGPVHDAIVDLSVKARRHGLRFGVFCLSPAHAAWLVERDLVDFVAIGTDLTLLTTAARTAATTYRSTP